MGDTERKPGTLKDWQKSHKYWGVHRIRGVVVWQCGHSHKTAREASSCAFTELLHPTPDQPGRAQMSEEKPTWHCEQKMGGYYSVNGPAREYFMTTDYESATLAVGFLNAQGEALAIAVEALGKLHDRSSMPWPEYGAKYGLDMSHTHHTSRWPTTFEITDSALSRIAEKKAGA